MAQIAKKIHLSYVMMKMINLYRKEDNGWKIYGTETIDTTFVDGKAMRLAMLILGWNTAVRISNSWTESMPML